MARGPLKRLPPSKQHYVRTSGADSKARSPLAFRASSSRRSQPSITGLLFSPAMTTGGPHSGSSPAMTRREGRCPIPLRQAQVRPAIGRVHEPEQVAGGKILEADLVQRRFDRVLAA